MNSNHRWLRLAAACLAMLALGLIYGWSVFSAPLQEEFGWDSTTLSFTFTLLMWMFCAGGVGGARLAKHTSVRFVICLSAVLVLLSFALTATLVSGQAPWVLHLTYGVLCGVSVGMSYAVIMSTIVAWYPDNSGAVSGVMLFCYSVSTLLLSSLATYLFGSMGWRCAFVIVGVGVALCLFLSVTVLRKPTPEEAALVLLTRKDQASDELIAQKNTAESSVSQRADLTTRQMLMRPLFYLYACWMLLVSCIGLGVLGASNHLALASGASVSLAVGLVGLLSVCNGFGRVVNGFIVDKIGAARAMALVSGLHAIGCVLMMVGLFLSSATATAAGMAVAGLGIGGTSVVGSNFLATTFGVKHYAENLSILNLVLIPAAFFGPLAVSLSTEQSGGYVLGILVLVVLGIASFFFSMVMMRVRKRHQR